MEAIAERRIEVAELERVFGMGSSERRNAGNGAQPAKSHSAQPGEVASLHRVIETLRATIAEQHATIRSIQDEKRALMALLTDRRPWWRRWFR